MTDGRFQKRIQRYGWDKAESVYETSWARQIRPAQDRLLALAGLQLGERVLDLACGTGLVTFPAAEAVGPFGAVFGTDISQSMVDAAAIRAARMGLAHVRFLRMDAESLDFPDASFDVALCSLGLMYFPDPVKALREVRRVLRPGGRVASVVWGERWRCGWAGIFPVVDSRVASEVCPMFFQLGTGENLRFAMEAAGFAEIAVERLQTSLHYETEDAACEAAFAGGPVALAWSRFDERTRREAAAEYLESIQPFRNGRGYNIPGEFVLATGGVKIGAADRPSAHAAAHSRSPEEYSPQER